jgi:hypothetical protein
MATRHWARDLDKPTRAHLFWCAEHRSEIEAWRDEMDPCDRTKRNHPSHIKRAFEAERRRTEAEEARERGEEPETKVSKGGPDDEALRKELTDLRTTLVKVKANPFPWWDGAANQGARSMFEDRGDGRRADGRARELLIALARQFKA